jgi:RimJ/RimL family protein N-acetyltransferase
MDTQVPKDVLSRLADTANDSVHIGSAGISAMRSPRDADAASMVLACNDAAARDMTELPSPYDDEHAREFISESAPEGRADGSLVAFVLADRADDVLGVVSLHDIDASATASVGYWVAPWARGRGVASAGLKALVNWSFDTLGLRHLLWQSVVGNITSLAVATNVGFRPEGTARSLLRQREAYQDGWLASIRPDDPRTPNPLRSAARVEIAAGAWQLQPVATPAEARAAEGALPVSACLPVGVWAVKHAVTADITAFVALLARDGLGWVCAVPARGGPAVGAEATATATAHGRDAVARYARLGLGLELP